MKRPSTLTLLVIGLALLIVVPSAVTYYTDWLWFVELGYQGVLLRTWNTQGVVFAITFFAVFAFLSGNLALARRSLRRPQIVFGTGIDGRLVALEGRQLATLARLASVLVALGLGVAGASQWLAWASFFQAVPFGTADPVFGRDVGFYVFRLPIYRLLQQHALFAAIVTIVGCGAFYVLSGSFVIEPRRGAGFFPSVRLVPLARRHLGLLGAVVFALIAWGTWLRIPGSLLTPATPAVAFGISYADAHARLPVLWLTVGALVAGAGLSVVYGFTTRRWPLPVAIGTYFAITMGGGLYAAFVQRLIVTPNELDREQPYIVHNIDATRRAYALDRVEERELSGDAELTPADIIANAATIENVRLWDHEPLKQTFAQIQEIRTYYDFNSVDNDRYRINGRYRQIMLSARELNPESIQNRSWTNERLFFTHGYGLTLGPVNQVTTDGLPVLYVRNIPPESTVDIRVDQPSIYFGELSSDYVLVRTRRPEFHYPRGDDNEETVYDGTGGVTVGSFWRRLLFAIRHADTDILVTDQLTPESRILYYRRIGARVRRLAPFLTYDSDPYPVVSDGRLFWIQDAYTASASYPYASPAIWQSDTLNYIRNSVKIVIDAYHGSTTFFLAEPDDPLALTLANVFPGLLKPLAEMPAGLRRHVRYPEDIFRIQTAIYQSYHMTNPQVFYNKEDQWQVPSLDVNQTAVQMQPYYTIMRLPGESAPEFVQMLPFTPRLKENLAAWMVARSDGAQYGRMLVFQFPKQKIIFGPKQIVGKINQDQVISPQITLWNQQGSQVIWGTLLVIPINESLLYVRPLYLRSPEGKIPELKQVVVAYQSEIVMADTLRGALGQIFGPAVLAALAPDRLAGSATPIVPTAVEAAASPAPREPPVPGAAGAPATWSALVAEMARHFARAERAQRDGDWALYGDEMKHVKEILARLEKMK